MWGLLSRLGVGKNKDDEGMAESERWLVVGLGNPGPKYAGNRHNAGFMVVDALAADKGERWKAHKANADVVETRIDGSSVVLAKPRTFMNVSGGPIAGLAKFYKVPMERIVVVHDEMDIDYGALKLKRGGGSGGHNGLKSTTASLSGPDYLRVRFGVGRPPGRMDPAVHVLRDFSSTERPELELNVERAADAVRTILTEGLGRAQNVFHTAA
ncbi:aminoacyl-tRNA hydrolase [Nocardiopsis alba]|jgi:PTH1 family peptidyl-tRNA hydrolase|uniref:aminoacyl-tRNA hydrolase n=1 Tax=Nocardiopsis alba TaxID=53437 RepID=UPI000347515B|nr:aminoacyl-tRNA hydrolase [Nocardiopsis alba]